jgi:hypothetical protein
MTPRFNAQDPKLSFSLISTSARSFIVPIYPQYHTGLLPDSILRTEYAASYVEQEPHRNAIRKLYISRLSPRHAVLSGSRKSSLP